ncbi:MAG: hypothetical protein IT385_15875 [Deltaproteobacteria bacterium]|nr:hypothetical protein [Deltaproteobacteria bacterium]
MMHRPALTTLVALASLGSAGTSRADTPRDMMLELHGGSYAPSVDDGVSGGTPWKDIFGSSELTLLGMHLDYQVWQDFGSIGIGGGIGYGWVDGTALDDAGEGTDDEVGFNYVPLTFSVTYRWDWAAVHHSVPFVPYVKVGLTAAMWWSTDAKDSISNTRDASGTERTGMGATFGWHAGGGLQFLLDVLAPGMAQGFDNESGVNNSYLFVELVHSQVDDFGSSTSLDLSDDALSFGLAFEF